MKISAESGARWPPTTRQNGSTADEIRGTLGVEGFNAFLEVVRLAQAAVAVPLELNRNGQR